MDLSGRPHGPGEIAPVDACIRVRKPSAYTFAFPNAFVCSDGRTYWLKSWAQQGLAAELIAGRLGHRLGAAPRSVVVRVAPEVVPDAWASHLEGIVLGVEHHPGMVNARDLWPALDDGSFDPETLNPFSCALTTAFQTWIDVADPQVLVNPRTGVMQSVDHGDCLSLEKSPDEGTPVFANIPGVSKETRITSTQLDHALTTIESLAAEEIYRATDHIPEDRAWKGEDARRIAIARWLVARRNHLRRLFETELQLREERSLNS